MPLSNKRTVPSLLVSHHGATLPFGGIPLLNRVRRSKVWSKMSFCCSRDMDTGFYDLADPIQLPSYDVRNTNPHLMGVAMKTTTSQRRQIEHKFVGLMAVKYSHLVSCIADFCHLFRERLEAMT